MSNKLVRYIQSFWFATCQHIRRTILFTPNSSEDRVSLQQKLLSEHRTRWLDVGSGLNMEEGFDLLDILPPPRHLPAGQRYYQLDILMASDDDISSLGSFDLIRMQHVLEHFTFEDGLIVLNRCAYLLRPDGILLVTVPDLAKYVDKYLNNSFWMWPRFTYWATKRIPLLSPDSFYFSIYCHSALSEPHKWCYDIEGLLYEINNSRCFTNAKPLSFTDPLASYPFTHNRPEEEICVVATRSPSLPLRSF